LAFVAGALPGSLIVAAINNYLYGSPLSSGYEALDDLFSITNVPATLTHYGRWLLQTQTPLAAAGIAALAVAPRAIWRTAEMRAAARALASITAAVWALYSVYPLFDTWWSLRFLLPSWPAMCLGVAALVLWPAYGQTRWRGSLHVGVLVALGVFGLVVAWQRGVFPAGEGERRYATIATLVEQQTEPEAMILASIHGGGALLRGPGNDAVRPARPCVAGPGSRMAGTAWMPSLLAYRGLGDEGVHDAIRRFQPAG
jgi:hypothetical protein